MAEKNPVLAISGPTPPPFPRRIGTSTLRLPDNLHASTRVTFRNLGQPHNSAEQMVPSIIPRLTIVGCVLIIGIVDKTDRTIY